MSAALLTLVFALAALLHGIAGIGFPLVLTSVLSLQMGMKEAVVLTAIPILLVNIISMVSGSAVKPVLQKYVLLAISSVLGSLIGVKLLLIVPSAWLQFVLALLVGFYVVSAGRQMRFTIPDGRGITSFFGLLAGIVGGATNAMSSVLMMYLLAKSHDKNEIAQAANLCFALAKVVQIVLLWSQLQQLNHVVWIVPTCAAIVALWVGVWLRRWIPFQQFRWLSLTILAVLASMMFYKSISSLIL